MLCNVQSLKVYTLGSVFFTLLLLADRSALAQTTPFKIRGSGVGPSGLPLPGEPARPHWILGRATRLGKHYGAGSVQTFTAVPDFENGEITGTFGSGAPFVFEAANGDKLACHYGRTDKGAEEPGTFVLKIVGIAEDGFSPIVEARWVAEFVVQTELCTGRFAGTSGSWIMYAQSKPFVLDVAGVYENDDPVYYSWEGQGELTFGND